MKMLHSIIGTAESGVNAANAMLRPEPTARWQGTPITRRDGSGRPDTGDTGYRGSLSDDVECDDPPAPDDFGESDLASVSSLVSVLGPEAEPASDSEDERG